jgi:hypothetical protein
MPSKGQLVTAGITLAILAGIKMFAPDSVKKYFA